jgi:hypothetical protein
LARKGLLTEPLTRGNGQQLAVLLRAEQVALVRTVLDLAANTLPVLLKRVVALDDRLQLEALRGVADLLAAQQINAPIDVLPRDARLDLLEPHEVLLVERAQTFEPCLQLLQRYVELGRFHQGPLGLLSWVKVLRADGRNRPEFPSH